ncbi:MAG: ABC transporter permease, partial [Phycisphaerales bacterium]|nr:ABC transporter permease [Phycisphaerales bacterium]
MRTILTLAAKDLRLLVRDRVGLFFALVFPLLYATFFGFIMSGFGGEGGVSGLRVRVVDEDRTPASAAYIERLEGASELAVTRTDLATAEAAVRGGNAVAFIRLEAGFGAAGETMFWGDPQVISVGIDPSRKAQGAMLQGILTKHAFEGMQAAFSDRDLMRRSAQAAIDQVGDDVPVAMRLPLKTFLGSLDTFFAAMPDDMTDESGDAVGPAGWEPVRITVSDVTRAARAAPHSAFEITFPQAIIWGVMGCAAGFGISLVTERVRGTLVRLRTSPATLGQILGGKAAACFVTIIVVATLLFGLAALPPFAVRPSLGALAMLVLAVVSVAACFVGIMMMLAVIGKTEAAAGGIGWACLTVMAMLGGGMLPLEFMPASLQRFNGISPVKWSILAMEGALWRDFTLGRMFEVCGILV